MYIDKGIRSRQGKLLPSGHKAIDTNNEYNEKTVLLIESQGHVTISDENWPEKLLLQVKMTPEILQSATKAERIESGKSAGKVSLYDPNCAIDEKSKELMFQGMHSAVLLFYTGIAKAWFENRVINVQGIRIDGSRIVLPDNWLLYRKPFLFQEAALVEEEYIKGQDNQLTIAGLPPKSVRLQAYGGLCDQKFDVIEPCFFQLINRGSGTRISVSTLTSWKDMGLENPVIGGQLREHTVFCKNKFTLEQSLSFFDCIKLGFAKINLVRGLNEQKIYKSSMAFRSQTEKRTWDILFIKEN